MNLKDMTIGVIGGGVVGQATARTYLEHVKEVRVWDCIKERQTHEQATAQNSDVVFVCLPEGKVDWYFATMPGISRGNNFVLKSTVPIGTTRRLAEQYQLTNLVHSPEFLTARCATVDAQLPTRNIVGCPHWDFLPGEGCHELLVSVYGQRFPGVPILSMNSDESEAVKLFVNGFFAVKVAYWNEVNQLTTTLGLDWPTIINAVLGDGRIHPSHTQVPGPDGQYGFGGKCLPKDLGQLAQCFRDNSLIAQLCEEAANRNADDRKRTK